MLNENSLFAIQKNSSPGLCKPLYESYCFSRFPDTFRYLLTGEGERRLPSDTIHEGLYDMVVFFFIDGFGWRFFEKYKEQFPFLKRCLEEGIVSKLTSQFPSTTAAHVTCINTGLDVGESGVYEWFYYEPLVDRVVAPLLFSYAGDHTLGTLRESGIASSEFYPKHTLYQKLRTDGITSYVMQHANIAHSPYSMAMFQGAFQIPYTSTKQAVENLVDLIGKNETERSYVYLYFGEIDAIGHRKGIDSEQFDTEVRLFFERLELFFANVKKGNKRIACLLSADHGMVEVNPSTTYYLNKEFPEIERYLQKNRAGKLIAPAGSCRDFFLHIQEERLDEAEEVLKEVLQDKAHLIRTQKLIQEGFFGEKSPSGAFLGRVGNLVILPHEGECVWWYEKHHFEQHFFGAHGGLSRHEVEIPLIFLSL